MLLVNEDTKEVWEIVEDMHIQSRLLKSHSKPTTWIDFTYKNGIITLTDPDVGTISIYLGSDLKLVGLLGTMVEI